MDIPPIQVNNSPNKFPEHLSENYDAGFSKFIPPVATIPSISYQWGQTRLILHKITNRTTD